ncbi:hypothetical protein [Cellulomonas sp. Y8]|jgi:hypothetical protein|uniref:hypothetical protein n=1 Tax=Cellulomonas sp. Y8 TaxID=2591145 RepID=UPI003D75AFD4
MSARRGTGLDRTVLTVLGLLLLVVGGLALAAGAGWTSGVRVGSVGLDPSTVDVGGAVSATSRSWWAGACAVAAVGLIVLGVLWLLRHLPPGGLPDQALPGSRTGERLRVDPGAVARGAEDRLEADPRVRGARLAVRRERAGLVLGGEVKVDARVDLPEVAALVDRVLREAAGVLGSPLAGRVRLRVSRRRARGPVA